MDDFNEVIWFELCSSSARNLGDGPHSRSQSDILKNTIEHVCSGTNCCYSR